MAEQKISFSVEVSAQDAIAKTGSLKAAIKEAERQAQELTLKGFGDEALIASKNAAKLKEELADVKDRIAALNPEAKFTAITSAASGIAGGFSAAQGAMALFGNESKDVEKAILKVQAAMAISEGLNSLRGMGDAFGNLKILILEAGASMAAYLGVVEGATVAQNILNVATALFKTLMGPVGIALAVLAAGIALYSKYVSENTAETEKNAKAQEVAKKALEDHAKAVEESEKRMREARQTTQTENEKLRKEYVAGLEQTRELEKSEEKIRYEREQKRLSDLTDTLSGNKKALQNEELLRLTHLQNLKEIDKKYDAEKSKENKIREDASEKKRAEDLKIENDYLLSQKEMRDFYFKNRIQEEKHLSEIQDFDAAANQVKRDKRAADEITLEQNLSAAKTQIATDTITALGLITEIGLGNSKEAMEFQKALVLFQIGVDTASAISGMTAAAFSIGHADNAINPAAPYIKLAAGTIAILSNINKAKNLLSGGGGTPTAPTMNIPKAPTTGSAAPNVSQQQQGLQQTVTTVGAGGQATSGYLRAYVVESEMTDKQKRINQIQKNTKF